MEPSEQLVYVFTPGKVGTTSIYMSLQEAGIPAFHVHYLSAKALQRQMERNLPEDGWAAELQRVHPAMTFSTKQLCIICPIREPVARAVSGYFQMLTGRHRKLGLGSETVPWSMEELTCEFMKRDLLRHDQWFRKEFIPELHFDPFQEAFDTERKHAVYKRGRIEFCFFRSDLPLSRQSELVSEFLNHEVPITTYNVGANKPLGALYDQFKQQLRLPDEKLEPVLRSRVFRHFFSDEEREAARAKYRQRVEA